MNKGTDLFAVLPLVFARSGLPLDLPGRMEDEEEPEPTIPNEKMTHPFIISILGSSLGSFQYAYMSYLMTSPIVAKIQIQNVEKEEIENNPVRVKLLHFLPIFFPLGGFVGMFLWGALVDRYGRKPTLLINNGISIFLSAILCFDKVVHHFEFILLVRFLVGIVTGMHNYSAALYVLEISSLNLRGAFASNLLFFVSWGYMLVQILTNPQIWGNEENYSLLVGIIAIVAIISSMLLVPSPESPRFLYLQRNDEEKARQVLKKLRGEEDVGLEMKELRQEHLDESSQKNMTVWKLLCFRGLRWHVITVIILVCGIRFMHTNAVLVLAQKSFQTLRLSARSLKLLPFLGTLLVELVLLTSVCTVESLGRRFLLLSGFLICIISSIGVVFPLQTNNPSLALISVVLIFLFYMGYITGPATIFPVIIGELFLQSSRASAYVLAGFISWGINFFSALLLLLTESRLENYYIHLYLPFMILTFVYTYRVVPETSGDTFQEIQENMAAWTSKNSRKITAQ